MELRKLDFKFLYKTTEQSDIDILVDFKMPQYYGFFYLKIGMNLYF